MDLEEVYKDLKMWKNNARSNNVQIDAGASDTGKLEAIITKNNLKK